MTLYLTGGSGYLGGEILKTAFEGDLEKAYVPVRDKKGQTGPERFKELYSGSFPKAEWIDPKDAIPRDTNSIILNAFDIRFNNEIRDVMQNSVAPNLKIMEGAKDLPNLQKIVFVSTAYVQLPWPAKLSDSAPFIDDPWSVYDSLLTGTLTWKMIQKDPAYAPHTKSNTYIFSKTLTENLLLTYSDLEARLTFVRPSTIGCTSDGARYSIKTPGCSVAALALSPVGRFVQPTACVDIVFVDHVAEDTLRGIRTDSPRYIWATNGITTGTDFMYMMNPSKNSFIVSNKWLSKLRKAEVFITKRSAGKKMGSNGLSRYYGHFY